MKIGFIGAGRVGFTLGKYFKEHNHDVSGYYSKSVENAKEAAQFTDTGAYDNPYKLVSDSDIIFITVNDGAIGAVYEDLKAACCAKKVTLSGKILCHCSGALSSKVFTDSEELGFFGYSIHPIYAVSSKLTSYINFQNAFITIEGHEKYLEYFLELFKGLGNEAAVIDYENKIKYHAACVFASNFVCSVYGAARELMQECGFTEELSDAALKGLFIDNARSIAANGVVKSLTGPAERADAATIEKHLKALDSEKAKLYKALTKEALSVAKMKNPDRDYDGINKLI